MRVGLVQQQASENKEVNRQRALQLASQAAEEGAQIICLQELADTRYFCRTQDPSQFALADPFPNPFLESCQALARERAIVLVVPFFERRGPGVYHNSAAVIDADGTLLGLYRKMHIPQDPGFEEKFYFTPGDLGYRTWFTRYGPIGVLICWDQWFPEAARLTALGGAQILFYPTAIGWLPTEKVALGAAQHNAWESVQRGHAVANGCFVAAVNRVGVEGETEFWGQSFVADPYGVVRRRASVCEEEVLLCDCPLGEVEDFRRIWPFFRDRRIETYSGISSRLLDRLP